MFVSPIDAQHMLKICFHFWVGQFPQEIAPIKSVFLFLWEIEVETIFVWFFRGMVDEEGDQFVAYFLPTSETRRKRRLDVDEAIDYNPEETYDYR